MPETLNKPLKVYLGPTTRHLVAEAALADHREQSEWVRLLIEKALAAKCACGHHQDSHTDGFGRCSGTIRRDTLACPCTEYLR